MEKKLRKKIENQLLELHKTGEIKEGKRLSKEIENIIGEKFDLNYQVYPSFNFLNLDKETVFCHLNPGANPDIAEFKKNKIDKFQHPNDFIHNYIFDEENYEKIRFLEKKEFDNFDYKQALYLSRVIHLFLQGQCILLYTSLR